MSENGFSNLGDNFDNKEETSTSAQPAPTDVRKLLCLSTIS